MIALVDCNNFYASCERVFRPDWEQQPIAVLSNNDGCVIARSNEAKPLVNMGMPLFKIPAHVQRQLVLVSSNYALYGDMSRRVTDTLREFTPEVDLYSIDESFLSFNGFPLADLKERCHRLCYVVKRNTGIPVSVGLSTSPTLAKIANRLAKSHPHSQGVCVLMPNSDTTRRILSALPIRDVWGVSNRLAQRFEQANIYTAWQLRESDPKHIRRLFSVVQERLVLELQGTHCISLEEHDTTRHHIMTSRSFGQLTGSLDELRHAIRAHAARGAEKLRRQGSVAHAVQVHLHTHRHRTDLPQYSPVQVVQLPHPTHDTRQLVQAAQRALSHIWRPGYRFMKAGVMMLDLIDAARAPLDLLDDVHYDNRQRHATLDKLMDELNRKMGRGTVRLGDTRSKAAWKLKADRLTPRYTTRWDELPIARL